MKDKIYGRILGWLQRRCKHHDKFVSVDLLEGDGKDFGVKWCRVCGATRRWRFGIRDRRAVVESDCWNGPRADWWL